MWGFGLLRSPPLLLLLPQLGLGIAASRSPAGTMNLGGGGSAQCSPTAEGRRLQCLRLSAVPGVDPQRSNEVLLLASAGEPERRDLSGDLAKEELPPPPQHHVVYFPGDVQVTWGLPGHRFLPCVCANSLGSRRAAAQPHPRSRWLSRYSAGAAAAASAPLIPSSCSPRGKVSLESCDLRSASCQPRLQGSRI